MNVMQIGRKARFEVDALRTGDVVSALWSDEEVYDAVNTAVDSAYRIMRLADSDIVSKTVRSTDAAVDLISEIYDPAELQITPDTTDYLLPPDCVRIVSVSPITEGFEEVGFAPSKPSNSVFIEQRLLANDDLSSARDMQTQFNYIQIGLRTLRLAPTPMDTIDLEIVYQYRPARLQAYSTGTVTLATGGTSVHGSGCDWVTAGVRTPTEFVIGTSVTLNRVYPTVSTITSDTNLTLARAYTGASGSAQAYRLAMVPLLPEEHHAWLAQMTAAVMLRKVSPELAAASVATLEKQLASEVQPELAVRQVHKPIIVEHYEIPS